MPCFGIDLSDFDRGRGPVDVAAMARDGIAFLTHKATEGTSIVHRYYAQTLSAARSTSIEFLGAYMVPRTPGNGGAGSIGAQVSYFLAYLDQQTPWWRTDPRFFLQVDTEHWSNAGGLYDAVSPQHGAQACALLRQQTGKWVVHYAPQWAYLNTIPGDEPLWASAYGKNPAAPYRQAYPGDGSSAWAPYSGRTPTFLQFGSRLTVGSQPGCDVNAYRGSLDELRALITGGTDMPSLDSVDLGRIAMAVQLGRTDLGNIWGQPSVPKAFADLPGHTGADLAASLNAKVDLMLKAQGVAQSDLDELQARPAATLTVTPETVQPLVDALTAVLVAHPDTPLDERSAPVIEAVLDKYFRTHFGQQPAQG